MTNPLHKVAERIGIEWVDDDWGGAWWDQHDETSRYGIHEAKLREHLLTGDRPLRIMEAIANISFVLTSGARNWEASLYKGGETYSGIAPTPAEAILACAEACV
jgi:hypothetical protein